LTDFLRKISRNLLNTIAAMLDNLGITPNMLTIIGVIGHLISASLIAFGYWILGALVMLFFGFFDALDGALARYQNRVKKYGAFLDSICDRISESFIFLGLFYFFASKSLYLDCVLVFLAAISAFLVSYMRARAESVGVTPKLGLMTRVERYIVLVLALLLNKMEIGLSIMAVLSLFTIGQRIWFVKRQLDGKE
jgi:CDP-diacylglycerol--glycerol-3-phosphate 3-phosphatidyltransferase